MTHYKFVTLNKVTSHPQQSVDTIALEAIEIGSDIDNGITQIQGALTDANELEKYETIVSKFDNIDSTTAEVLDIAVEAIYTRLGITRKSVLAMEGIGDVISRTWEAIKKAFIRLWGWIKSFFSKSKAVNQHQKKEVEEISKEVKAIPSNVKEVDDIKEESRIKVKEVATELKKAVTKKKEKVKKKEDLEQQQPEKTKEIEAVQKEIVEATKEVEVVKKKIKRFPREALLIVHDPEIKELFSDVLDRDINETPDEKPVIKLNNKERTTLCSGNLDGSFDLGDLNKGIGRSTSRYGKAYCELIINNLPLHSNFAEYMGVSFSKPNASNVIKIDNTSLSNMESFQVDFNYCNYSAVVTQPVDILKGENALIEAAKIKVDFIDTDSRNKFIKEKEIKCLSVKQMEQILIHLMLIDYDKITERIDKFKNPYINLENEMKKLKEARFEENKEFYRKNIILAKAELAISTANVKFAMMEMKLLREISALYIKLIKQSLKYYEPVMKKQ